MGSSPLSFQGPLSKVQFGKKTMTRGQKKHINIWHINNFSVTPVLGGYHWLFSVHTLFPQGFLAFIHGFFRNENATFTESLLCSLFTIWIQGQWFTNHCDSNHIHIITPIKRIVATRSPIPAGYPAENVYVPWVPHTTHKHLAPGHPVGRPPPHHSSTKVPPYNGNDPRPPLVV